MAIKQWALVAAVAVAGCGAPPIVAMGPMGAPQHAPYHARQLSTSILKVDSGSPAGLVVGGGTEGEKAPQIAGLSFAENADPAGSFVWAFAPGAKLLDRDCQPVTQAAAIDLANSDGDKSAMFIVYLDASGGWAAPPKIVIWNRGAGDPQNCQGEETPPV